MWAEKGPSVTGVVVFNGSHIDDTLADYVGRVEDCETVFVGCKFASETDLSEISQGSSRPVDFFRFSAFQDRDDRFSPTRWGRGDEVLWHFVPLMEVTN